MIKVFKRLIFRVLKRFLFSLRLYGKYLDLIYNLYGIEGINRVMLRTRFPKYVLTKFGAKIGEGTVVFPHITIHDAEKDYSNLIVGKNCRLMRDCFLDLSAPIELCDTAIIGLRASIITHLNVGDSDLKNLYPAVSGGVKIGRGSVIMANAIILHGVTIGEYSVIGAGTLVRGNIPPYSLAVGGVTRIVKKLEIEKINNKGSKRQSNLEN